jgi:PKD repeat protein
MWFSNTDPVAQFTATPAAGVAPLDVWFDASTSSDPDQDDISCLWTFGDGAVGTGVTCTHRFTDAGTYRVELTVDDGWGGVAETWTDILVSEPTRAYYAVIVGIANYAQDPLQYTDDDARDLASALLRSPALWDAANIHLLLDDKATGANFMAALDAVSVVAEPNDVLLFFYSGHGSQARDGMPFDEADGTDEALCFFDYDILDDWLASLLRAVPVGQLLVMVDACYSGGLIRGKSSSDEMPHSAGLGVIEDLVRPGVRDRKDLNEELPQSIVALTASASYEYSIEWPSFRHGAFTYFLLEAMSGLADAFGNGDGLISAEECFAYLSPRVISFTASVGALHHPQIFDSAPEELVFAE